MARAHARGRGGGFLFRSDNGDLFTLNATGELVWRLRAAGHSAESIARSLARRYRLDPARARLDVFAFLAQARRHGLDIA